MYRLARKIGLRDPDKPSSYKRFRRMPIVDQPAIAYRGDTRAPATIKQAGGFSSENRANITLNGLSSGMAALTRIAEVAATYVAYADIFTGGGYDQGYVYVIYVPPGYAIDVEEIATRAGSRSSNSHEITPLSVPWANILGWREMPAPQACRPIGNNNIRNVGFRDVYQVNPECNINLENLAISADELISWHDFQRSSNIDVLNSRDVF